MEMENVEKLIDWRKIIKYVAVYNIIVVALTLFLEIGSNDTGGFGLLLIPLASVVFIVVSLMIILQKLLQKLGKSPLNNFLKISMGVLLLLLFLWVPLLILLLIVCAFIFLRKKEYFKETMISGLFILGINSIAGFIDIGLVVITLSLLHYLGLY